MDARHDWVVLARYQGSAGIGIHEWAHTSVSVYSMERFPARVCALRHAILGDSHIPGENAVQIGSFVSLWCISCSLAGWGLAAEMVQPLDQHLRESLGVPPSEFTACETTHKWFADANVTAFACTHTCMAYAQGFPAEKGLGNRAVFNNGSSGMPNFQGGKCGVITRVSSDLTPPRDSLYGCTLGGPTPGSEVNLCQKSLHRLRIFHSRCVLGTTQGTAACVFCTANDCVSHTSIHAGEM
jgi:hypothetical protein